MKKEVKIGLTVFVSFLILVWGFNYLKGRNIIEVGKYYYGAYARIDGLTKASPVYYKGFKVGSVRHIEFHPSKPDEFLVTFALFDELKIPDNSHAQIYSLDLMGSKGVQFIPGDSDKRLVVGDTLNTSVMGDFADKMSMEVLPLKDKAERLFVKLDTVLTKMADMFSEEQSRFHSSMVSLNRSMKNFESISGNLAKKMKDGGDVSMMLSRTDSVMAMLSSQRSNVDTTFSNLARFSQQLENAKVDESIEQLRLTMTTANALLDSVNNGQGSLGMLMTDEELYNSLTDVSASLNRLLMDVRHNPKRYVSFSAVNFGKKVVVSDNAYGVSGVVYQVVLQESKMPLNFDLEILNGKYRVFEDYRKSTYFYSIGQVRTFDEAQIILDEVKEKYDESKIIALENGEPISVKKAQKITK